VLEILNDSELPRDIKEHLILDRVFDRILDNLLAGDDSLLPILRLIHDR
jgi:hypothetical protein